MSFPTPALARLAEAALSDEQLARLAGLPAGDVGDLLGDGSARDALQPR